MNPYLKPLVVYIQLYLFAVNFTTVFFVNVDYYGSRNQSRHATVISYYNMTDVLNLRLDNKNQDGKELRAKPNELFIDCGAVSLTRNNYIVVFKSRSSICTFTPNYLLSSSLKSPPLF